MTDAQPTEIQQRLAAIAQLGGRGDLPGAMEATAAALLADTPEGCANELEILSLAETILAHPTLAKRRRSATAELLGICALRRNDLTEAAAHFRRGFNWRPEETVVARQLVGTLQRLGEMDEAAAVQAEHDALLAQAIGKLARWQEPARDAGSPGALYLDLLEKAVSNWFYGDPSLRGSQTIPFDPARREVGRDIPQQAHSMIGLRRLRHLRCVAEQVLRDQVAGDFLEAGVWRGGACILLRGVLAAYGVKGRRVVVADSFAGLPPPDPRHPKDAATLFDFHTRPELAVSLDSVKRNFAAYGLLDDQVEFVPGFFAETLPGWAPGRQLAILRLDGDLYSSTMDTLEALYDRVAPGGFIIADDYGVVVDARRAILDFRRARGIDAPMEAIDGDAVVWRKPGGPPPQPIASPVNALRELPWHVAPALFGAPRARLEALEQGLARLVSRAPMELSLGVLQARVLALLGEPAKAEAAFRRVCAGHPEQPLPAELLIAHLRRFGPAKALAEAHSAAVARFGPRPNFGEPPA